MKALADAISLNIKNGINVTSIVSVSSMNLCLMEFSLPFIFSEIHHIESRYNHCDVNLFSFFLQ